MDAPAKVDMVKQNKMVTERFRPIYCANFSALGTVFTHGAWPGIADLAGSGIGKSAVIVAPGPYVVRKRNREFVGMANAHPDLDVFVLNRAVGSFPKVPRVFCITSQPSLAGHLALRDDYTGATVFMSAFSHPLAVAEVLKRGGDVRFYGLQSNGIGPEPPAEVTDPITGPGVVKLASAGVVSAECIEFCLWAGYKNFICVGFEFSNPPSEYAETQKKSLEIQRVAFLTHIIARGLEGRIWNLHWSLSPPTWGGPYIIDPDQAEKKFF